MPLGSLVVRRKNRLAHRISGAQTLVYVYRHAQNFGNRYRGLNTAILEQEVRTQSRTERRIAYTMHWIRLPSGARPLVKRECAEQGPQPGPSYMKDIRLKTPQLGGSRDILTSPYAVSGISRAKPVGLVHVVKCQFNLNPVVRRYDAPKRDDLNQQTMVATENDVTRWVVAV